MTGAHSIADEEWALPAGVAAGDGRLLSLRELAAGAAERPLAALSPEDRQRLVAARLEMAGARRLPALAEVEWIALGFLRAGPPEVRRGPALPHLPANGDGIVAGHARWDAFSQAARQWRRQRLESDLPGLRTIADESVGGAELPLGGGRLSRAALQTALAAGPARLLTLSGHGRPGGFFGDAFELLLSAHPRRPRLPAELRGCLVHLLACHCGRALGAALVAAGAAGFVGYADDFVFDEEDVDIFFECDAEIVRALAAGAGVEEAARRSRARSEAEVTRLRGEGEVYRAAMLQFNAEHLVAIVPKGTPHAPPCGPAA